MDKMSIEKIEKVTKTSEKVEKIAKRSGKVRKNVDQFQFGILTQKNKKLQVVGFILFFLNTIHTFLTITHILYMRPLKKNIFQIFEPHSQHHCSLDVFIDMNKQHAEHNSNNW